MYHIYTPNLPDDIPIIVDDDANEIYEWFQNNTSFPLIVFLDHDMKIYHMENDGIPSIETINGKINEMLINIPTMSISVNDETSIANNFHISQLYPNPFNPVLQIKFDIPWSRVTQIDILNIAGNKIETIHTGFLQSGSHEMNWNAESMPSGVYLVSLKSGDQSLTQKVALLK